MKKKIAMMGLSMMILGSLAACSTGNTTKKTDTQTKETETVVSDSKATESTDKKVDLESMMSVETVIEAFQKAHEGVDITDIELEESRGSYVFKVDGVDDDNDYEMTFDASTKEVMQDKSKKLDRDEQGGVKRNEDKVDVSNLMSLQEVTDIAEKESGITSAISWKLEQDLGTTYWEITLKEGLTKEVEVKVNAQTGEVLKVEKD